MPNDGHQSATGRDLPSKPVASAIDAGASSAAIFINYRRADSDMPAGRLADLLKARFGSSNVFMDIDGINPGVDFVDVICGAIE
jgi:hypothetical protein